MQIKLQHGWQSQLECIITAVLDETQMLPVALQLSLMHWSLLTWLVPFKAWDNFCMTRADGVDIPGMLRIDDVDHMTEI